MRSRFNRHFYIDLGIFLLQFVNAWLAWQWWHDGNGLLFAMSGCGFIFGMWYSRRFLGSMTTLFCMWWLHRKAKLHVEKFMAQIEQLKQQHVEGKEKENEESN